MANEVTNVPAVVETRTAEELKRINRVDSSDLFRNIPDARGGYGGLDDYLVFDTRASYKVNENLTASFGVDNLTDVLCHESHPYARRTFFVSPDGSGTIAASPAQEGFHTRHALSTPGTYMAVIVSQPGFSSKTTEGYKQGKTKKNFKEVVSCSYSEKFSKALFTVGKAGGTTFSKTLGHSLEIVPLQDSSAMKVGQVMAVKVLFQGKPLPSATVSGVYAGFSDDPGTFVYSTSSNKEGIAKVKLIHSGPWLLLVKQKNAYPDTTVCDTKFYSSSLTFNVR